MIEDAERLNKNIAHRVKQLRIEKAMSLDALADASGVSRSMISVIERGEANPTAVVLNKLAGALGVGLATLFDLNAQNRNEHAGGDSEIMRALHKLDRQRQWRDPETGYVRRNLTPPAYSDYLQLTEVRFPPGEKVTFDALNQQLHQQLWMLSGTMNIKNDVATYTLEKGDCLAMQTLGTVRFHNPGTRAARYLVAVCPCIDMRR